MTLRVPRKENAKVPNPPQKKIPPNGFLISWCRLVDSLRSDMKNARKEKLTPSLPTSEKIMVRCVSNFSRAFAYFFLLAYVNLRSQKFIDGNVKAQSDNIDKMIKSHPPKSWGSVSILCYPEHAIYPAGLKLRNAELTHTQVESRNVELAYRLSSILGLEIIENLRNIWASDYLNLLSSQNYDDDDLQKMEEGLDGNEHTNIHRLVQEAQKMADVCQAKGKILDFGNWLYLKRILFGYASQQLEDLRDKMLKTYWKAESYKDEDAMLKRYPADIGQLLFHEAGHDRTEIKWTYRESGDAYLEVQVHVNITEMSKQIDKSVLEPDSMSFFPGDFFTYPFSFANL